jgi:hypothetical protein
MKSRFRYTGPLLLAFLMLIEGSLVRERVSAIQTESQAEKQANFKQQALGGFFHRWTFDQQKSDEGLEEFSQLVVGGGAATVWTISAEGSVGRGGIVIGLKDEKHFYAAVVDLAAKKLEVIRVFDEQVTVLGETVITPSPSRWIGIRYASTATRSSARM